jgi:hypothetical protein
MMTAPSGRILFVVGAAVLLAIGGVAVAGTVGSASGPGQELGPPVVVHGTATSTTPGATSSGRHTQDGEHGGGPSVVSPAPAHEVDDDDRTTPTAG